MRGTTARATAIPLLATAWLALLGGCASPPPHEYVAGDPQEQPRLRFCDGSVSLNDRCPVTQTKLNRALDPVFVNGRPVGFC